MKTNEELQKEVQDAIKWEPLLHAAEIGVTVKDGIVTLSGTVDNYYKKTEADYAAKKVAGVRAVVENIKVQYADAYSKSDANIASDLLVSFEKSLFLPSTLKFTVEDGWVTLDGEVEWNYQKEIGRISATEILGVKGVTNQIVVKPSSQSAIEKKHVENALARHWGINAKDIIVSVSGTTVTLSGNVTSLYQKEEAVRIAWNTPGVAFVKNELVVDYDYAFSD
ncbi:ornithine aminotransferase [Flavobacterium noncentrifugens]|uniref:Osmotically-inducible protein OsmY, contains BON domain n=1 Tax=Flavobacterium noncentrifugens TaxID=1128970 RepID=A0A1G8WVS5_9FLAO|nr:BON domain-containing protein [Flavobacterium noncentrifugens]GEP51074.1 ornithine aminotransferase [Flavobacterium noncentrifugens]SDJ82489.1 Osmotically-inducible protein OsmY, contains BON domain [Flavobacterium noncentrifugens]